MTLTFTIWKKSYKGNLAPFTIPLSYLRSYSICTVYGVFQYTDTDPGANAQYCYRPIVSLVPIHLYLQRQRG